MKIGIDAHFVGSRHGGNEYVFENMLRTMAERPVPDEQLYAFSFNLKAKEVLPEKGINLVPLRLKSVYLQRALEIPRLTRKLDLDILHVPFNFMPLGRCRKVIHVHDLAFLHLKDSFTFSERQRMALMTSFCGKRADHVFTISEFSKADIIKTYRLPESKVTVTPLAMGSDEFRPWDAASKSAFRDRHGLHFPFILFVGTLQPRKNVITLLKAFKSLVAQGDQDSRLVLVGRKGWIYEDLFDYIGENGLENRVIHRENVNTRDLAGYYNTAEVFAFPSLFEGFGLPIVEAMACGCPVISSDTSSMPEVYGDAALSFSPLDAEKLADHLRTMLTDGPLRADYIRRGLANCTRFTWARTIDIIRKVYRSL
jgi:glycosyltransferase involved in cell wall biosynthesis